MKLGSGGCKKHKTIKKVLLLVSVLILFLSLNPLSLYAQEDIRFSVSQKEVVFLVDASKSMGEREDGAVTDAVRQILYSLPSDIKAGLVVYNTDIQGVAETGSEPRQIDHILSTMEYTGYSNAGLGLEQALSLFSDGDDLEKHIILVSDGEIDMKSDEESEASKEKFMQEAERAADQGIRIHILTVDGLPDEEREIPGAAQISGGGVFREGPDGELCRIAEEILYGQFNFPRKAVGIMEGNSGNFHVEIPVGGASRVKVLLMGNSEMENVNAGYMAESGQVITGKRFAVVDLYRPEGAVDVTFDLKETSTVEAWLITEYQAILDVGMEYRTETIQEEKGREPTYRHYADLEIKMLDQNDENLNLWAAEYYNGQSVLYTVNGEEFEGKIENGAVCHTMTVDGQEEVEVSVRTDAFYEIYGETMSVKMLVELPPDPVAEADHRPLWYILGGMAAAFIIILAVWMRKGKEALVYAGNRSGGSNNLEKYEVKSCQYTGKLNLYVVQTPNGRDIAPQTLRLFGRKSGRITLEWILNNCGIKLGSVGAGDIVFYPGPEKAVVVMDQSEQCTVMRGMEILKKGIGYPVYYNEKLTVTMEDGVTELEIHYKNLKPSERESEKR